MLETGDVIGICAPSGSFDRELFEKGLAVISKMGFDPVVPGDIYQKKRYLAGSDKLRARIINDLFLDKNIHGIMCARGGYGAVRVLKLLDWEIIQNNPKVFIGFSDVTALLANFSYFPHMKAVHGPNITSLANAGQQTKDSIYEFLTAGSTGLKIEAPVVINKGKCTGKLLGGNLATLNHLVGTEYQVDFKDCIFFLEDVGEPPYKIDRMLTQMKMAGCFYGIKGVAAGSFENCTNLGMIEDIIGEIFGEYDIPVIAGIESGHGPVNLPLPMGVDAELLTDDAEIRWDLTHF